MTTPPRGGNPLRLLMHVPVPWVFVTSSRLVTWGPYRLSRNPMYVSLSLACLGEAGMLRQVWPVVLLPLTVAYLSWIVIPVEEARLAEAFREDYERYRS